ncbi:ATP-dependent helicase [Acidipropionibacterium jensenii]|uniref:ATP-dependent helicase n=1 Tax=Acidipropionibacterium jensenii TaxID=1749 RepID=A0A3S4WXV0_9ACTN|nr:DEAD/DEAH box helicase [Acidipropionibacterium jensenii]VEI03719.1 ATP-dependent helicase [Acidipropionibacterium jensenii]
MSGAEVVHIDHRDAMAGRTTRWPQWLPADVVSSIEASGIPRPWLHQCALAELAFSGHHCAICTSTASGKTLAYLLPVMAATASVSPVQGTPALDGVPWGGAPGAPLREPLVTRRRRTALYLAPTKALAHDQWRVCREIGPDGWPVATLDGDSDQAERRFARDEAGYVLTNPDMLHRSVLPNHSRWRALLGGLSYVVVDEAHRYRGVFGAHVAQVLRRLRRLCRMYGADPVFILSSATATNAAEAGRRLVGVPAMEVVDADSSPHPARDVVLWQPADSTTVDAARLVAALADDRRQTICFVASRALAEVIAVNAQDRVTSGAVIASYRSGYLPQDRRRIEAGLQDGSIRAVVATNALELGVDVSGMDAVVIVGYPGRLSVLWQQAGRAGRAGHDALVVVLAREDPLDQYLFSHPDLIFSRSVETTVLHPDNPYVMGPHLAAAAQEGCLTPADEQIYGTALRPVADLLVSQKVLRRRGQRLFWTRPDRAVDAIDLRSMGGPGIDVIDRTTGRVIGVVDERAGDRTVHPGAVYLLQGEQWLVDEYLPEEHQALVHRDLPGYWTQPQSASTVHIVDEVERRGFGPGYVATGDVELTEQVIGYLRRDEISNEVWDSTALEMPVHTMVTQACWFVVPDPVVDRLGLSAVALAGAAHGTEHTAIGILPAFAPCDRWDIGGVSTALLADTGACTIVIHDGQAGGAGFARSGYEQAERWWHATSRRLLECPCESGCPSCVVSPKCGNANQMLDKGSARLLASAMDPLGGQ